MTWGERLMRRLFSLLGFTISLVAVFALLWLALSRVTRRPAFDLPIVGTLLTLLVALLIVWAQASGA